MRHDDRPLPDWSPASWRSRTTATGGLDLGADDVGALVADGLVDQLVDGRWTPLPLLLDGTVLTHVVTDDEARLDLLAVHPDLTPLEPALCGLGLERVGGGRVSSLTAARARQLPDLPLREYVTGPPGWIADFGAGAALRIELRGGRLRVRPLPRVPEARPAHGAQMAAELRRTLAAARKFADNSPIGAPILDAIQLRFVINLGLATGRLRLDRPGPPLGDRIVAAGLASSHGWIGLPGTDLSRLQPMPAPPLPVPIAASLVSDAAAELLADFVVAVSRCALGAFDPTPRALRHLATGLEHDGVLEALVLCSPHVDGMATLGRLLLPLADGTAAAGAHALVALGSDPATARQHLDAALLCDPTHEVALRLAARLADDVGDVADAEALYRRAGATDDDAVIMRLRSTPPRDAALPDRCPHLWLRAAAWATDISRSATFRRLGRTHVDCTGDPNVLTQPEFFEQVLFDLGQLDAFLAARAAVLPADEVALLRSWIGVPARLGRVVGIGADHVVLEVLDAPDGTARMRLSTRSGPCLSLGFEPGSILLHRALPDGAGGHWLSLGVCRVHPAVLEDVSRLLAAEAGPEELTEALTVYVPGAAALLDLAPSAARSLLAEGS